MVINIDMKEFNLMEAKILIIGFSSKIIFKNKIKLIVVLLMTFHILLKF